MVLNGNLEPQTLGAGLEGKLISINPGTFQQSPPFVHFFDITREHTRFHVSTASCQQNIIGMPIHGQDRGSDGFLEVFGNPPVTLFIERTHSDRSEYALARGRRYYYAMHTPRTTGNGELVLQGAPPNMSGGTIDSQQYEGRLPNQLAGLSIWGLRPNIRISVLRSGDDTVRHRSPVNRGDQFVVL